MRRIGLASVLACALAAAILFPSCKGEREEPSGFEFLAEPTKAIPDYQAGNKSWTTKLTFVNNTDRDMGLKILQLYIYDTDTGYNTYEQFTGEEVLQGDSRVKARSLRSYNYALTLPAVRPFNSGKVRLKAEAHGVDGEYYYGEVIVSLLN